MRQPFTHPERTLHGYTNLTLDIDEDALMALSLFVNTKLFLLNHQLRAAKQDPSSELALSVDYKHFSLISLARFS